MPPYFYPIITRAEKLVLDLAVSARSFILVEQNLNGIFFDSPGQISPSDAFNPKKDAEGIALLFDFLLKKKCTKGLVRIKKISL